MASASFTAQELIETISRQQVRFVIDPLGPLKFRLKPMESREIFTVSIGSEQHCTCHEEMPCVHILYVMMRYFGVPRDCDVVWQQALTDHEIDNLLSGRIKRIAPAPKKQESYRTKSGKTKVKRLPITEEDDMLR